MEIIELQLKFYKSDNQRNNWSSIPIMQNLKKRKYDIYITKSYNRHKTV